VPRRARDCAHQLLRRRGGRPQLKRDPLGRGRVNMIFRFSPTLVVLLTACLVFPISRDEVARVVSSSGRLDAVLVETNGGATTSFGYLVYVVPHGAKPSKGREVAWLYGAGRNEHAYGANLKWEGVSALVVEYREAREVEVRRKTSVLGADTIAVVLRSGVTDSAAPAGGMLYNLQKGRR
jgi:hypothetical protein